MEHQWENMNLSQFEIIYQISSNEEQKSRLRTQLTQTFSDKCFTRDSRPDDTSPQSAWFLIILLPSGAMYWWQSKKLNTVAEVWTNLDLCVPLNCKGLNKKWVQTQVSFEFKPATIKTPSINKHCTWYYALDTNDKCRCRLQNSCLVSLKSIAMPVRQGNSHRGLLPCQC
jgi:hypothetical protein